MDILQNFKPLNMDICNQYFPYNLGQNNATDLNENDMVAQR